MRDALDPDHWINGGECDYPHPDALAMEALDAEIERLKQALHDARIENSGQAAELERIREARRWIPVNEAHPPANEMVLVCIGSANRVMMCSIDMSGVWRGYTPTHWMPLPQMPSHFGEANKKEVLV